MTDDAARARWVAMCNAVTDRMKEFTRPYVTMLVSPPGEKPKIGTGTFIENGGRGVLTCNHVALFDPSSLFIDEHGSIEMTLGAWRADKRFDVACAPVSEEEWGKCQDRATLLPMSKLASSSASVASEVLFFRGIAGENARYLGAEANEVTLTAYCSQKEPCTGDQHIFEMLWHSGTATVTSGTADEARAVIKQDNPQGFSGSLVWNTRFVERGCDLSAWSPEDAVVMGMLRHYDKGTNTLLAWRVEHIRSWLADSCRTAKDAVDGQ